MTALLYENQHTGTDANLQIWRCDSCHCVHLRAGQVLLTFTQEEFASFTQEIVDCYCGQVLHAGAETGMSDELPPVIITSEETH